MKGDIMIGDIKNRDQGGGCQREINGRHSHLIGCVLRAVFRLSMVLFLSSSSSFSRARRVFLCPTTHETPSVFTLLLMFRLSHYCSHQNHSFLKTQHLPHLLTPLVNRNKGIKINCCLVRVSYTSSCCKPLNCCTQVLRT